MNTPAHIMLSVALLSRSSDSNTDSDSSAEPPAQSPAKEPTYLVPAVIGAVLPDAPMFVFYGIEKFILGSSERAIWTSRYFLSSWQDFFDLFNSLPIAMLCWWMARRSHRKGLAVLFASMLLHLAADLPLHHDDGHRHFWPLSDWRFESPVSYWDPNHFGIHAGAAEFALFIGCYLYSMHKHKSWAIRGGLSVLAALHTAVMLMIVTYWTSLQNATAP